MLISCCHAVNLAASRCIRKVFVLIIQPRTDLECSSLPSPNNLRMEMAQSRWIGSCGETGRKRVWIASGIASRALSVNSGLCNDVVIISSMYDGSALATLRIKTEIKK